MTVPEREIKCSPNSLLNKSTIALAVWHVETTCRASQAVAFWVKKIWISSHGSGPVTLTIRWKKRATNFLNRARILIIKFNDLKAFPVCKMILG